MKKYLFTIICAVGLAAHSMASGAVPKKAQTKPVVPAKVAPKLFQPAKPVATPKKRQQKWLQE